MARPSNEELLEERRALEEILIPTGDETNVDAARRLVADLAAALEAATAPPPDLPADLDGSGWPLKPELQDERGVKTPGYLRWLHATYPEIYAAKRGGNEPPQGD